MIKGTPTPAELDSAALQATEFPEYYKNAAETINKVASLMQKNQELAAQANYELAQKAIDTASHYGAQVADKTAELYTASEKWAGNTYESAVNKTSDIIEHSVDGYNAASAQASEAIDKTWAHVADETAEVKEALIDRVNELDQQLETASGEAKEVLIREYNKTMRYLRNEQEDYSNHTNVLPEVLQYPYQEKESLPDTPIPYRDGYSTIDPKTGKSRSNYIPMDIQTGPCLPCRSVEPCCIRNGIIMDRDETSRLLKWPVIEKNQSTRMFVVAKDVGSVESLVRKTTDDSNIIGHISVQVGGQSCQPGIKDWPYLDSESDFNGSYREGISGYANEQYHALPCPQEIEGDLTVIFANPFIDPKFIIFIYLLSGVTDIFNKKYSSTTKSYKYKLGQCGDNRYYPEFEILPVPFFSLGGGVEANLSIKLSYGYISCDFDFGGEYKAVLGKYSYIASKGVVDKKKQKERNQPAGGRIDAFPELPGGLNVISKVLNNAGDFADDYRAKGKPDLLMEKYSTYFEFFLKAGAKAEGVVLRAKEYTPDLSLDFGGGEVSIGGGIRVQVEIVDILLAWLSTYIPGSYQPLVNVRKQLARGETVSGECFAILSGVGMIDRTWKIGSMGKSKLASITIPANESDDYDIDFSGEILDKTSAQIIAKLEVALRAEIKVWTVTGKAGVEGTAHTQLLWQWKQDPELGEVH